MSTTGSQLYAVVGGLGRVRCEPLRKEPPSCVTQQKPHLPNRIHQAVLANQSANIQSLDVDTTCSETCTCTCLCTAGCRYNIYPQDIQKLSNLQNSAENTTHSEIKKCDSSVNINFSIKLFLDFQPFSNIK